MDSGESKTNRKRLTMFGLAGSAAAYTLRDFLQRSSVEFDWIELSSADDAHRLAGVDGMGDPRLPICVFPDGSRLESPNLESLAEKLGWYSRPSRSEYDVAIYGAGPAGLSAAVYAASEGLRTILIEKSAIGGQAGTSSKIENYLGFPDGISGAELALRARDQASRFGADILLVREGVRAEFSPGRGVGTLADGTKIVTRVSICAAGIEYRHLDLDNEGRFYGKGVFYGAGVSEASLCAGADIFVVGGGNSAGQAAMHFSTSARKVSLLIRGRQLSSTLSQYLVDRISSTPNIEVLPQTSITELHGDNCLEGISIMDGETKSIRYEEARWVFVCIGGLPRTEWTANTDILVDEAGYLLTGPDLIVDGKLPSVWPLDRQPYYVETSVPGMFAVGDIRHGSVKRVASAVGEGAMAVTFAHKYLSSR
jgi:thioredoxin reductase (NADPH)